MSRGGLLLLISLSPFLPTRSAAAQAVLVDDSATGANNGTSWANAYVDLQSALAMAGPGTQIWVAAGTYRPSSTGNRRETFLVPVSVHLFGGFAGTETSLAERAGLFDATILSGDLNGDDGPGFANVSDNSLHVVELWGLLDGFTVSGGNAEASNGGALGSGFAGHFLIQNCTFRANRADGNGGAIATWFNDGSLVRRCVFLGNQAGGQGGAVYDETMDTAVRYEACRFVANSAAGGGGAFAGNQFGELIGCEFAGNKADGPGSSGGGAILVPYPNVVGCTLWSNTAFGSPVGGGGIVTAAVWLEDCILWGNVDSGGRGEDAQLHVGSGFLLTLQNNCIEGWSGRLDDGHGNISSDPVFVDARGLDGTPGTLDDDLRLDFGSPCVDTGSIPHPYLVLDEDLEGNPRLTDALACDRRGLIDMGAHERNVIDGTTSYCPQPPTSLGVPAELSAPCIVHRGVGELLFRVAPVRASLGFLFRGPEKASVPFGIDARCIGGGLQRVGSMEVTGDSLARHVDTSGLVAGSTWHFQALFRDAGSLRLSDATSITFLD